MNATERVMKMIRALRVEDQEEILENIQDELCERRKRKAEAQAARRRLGCMSREEFCKRYA